MGIFSLLFENIYDHFNRDIYDLDFENHDKIAQVNKEYGTQKSVFTRMISSINKQRRQVYEGSLTQFVYEFQRITRCELVYHPKLYIEVKPQLEKLEQIELFNENGRRIYTKSASRDISEEIDVAVKMRRLETLKIRSINKFLKSLKETIDVLDKLLIKALPRLRQIVDEKGNDYSTYSDDEKAFIKSIYNLANALTFFISETYITPKGNLRQKYKRFALSIPRGEKAIMNKFANDTM